MAEAPGASSGIRLDTPVQYVKGVGPARALQLNQLGIVTVEDLLFYFPRRFNLRRQVQPIASIRGDEDQVTVAGEVLEVSEQTRGRLPWLAACVRDETGMVLVKWFHGLYLRDQVKPGMTLALSGRPGIYRESLQLINPRHQVIYDPAGAKLDQDELLPVYPAGAKLTSAHVGQIIKKVLPLSAGLVQPWFDREFLEKRGLMSRPAAVAAMHRPEDQDQWGSARRRLAYDECFLMQLGIAMTRLREVSRPAHPLPSSPLIDQRITARFPFEMTAAQRKAAAEISADLARERPMNRLLQGDVGSGKTVVALYAALLAVANRKQVAIMAPTEILATQHYRKIVQYLAGSRVKVGLLLGGQAKPQRTAVLEGLATRQIDIVVGTHALLGEGVKFAALGLVVVDEQHKFGVRQRSGIRGKGFAPHYLVMTATPIPRTLAMTVFGDLDVSVIDELPPGRGRTTTRLVEHRSLIKALAEVREHLQAHQRAYIVYPLVRSSPELELSAVEEARRDLSAGPLSGFKVGVIHGQMPATQKQKVMDDFAAGRVQVLAASVVVEVGLDVPEANVIVIMHAERFGLAQLHQLRGRVGRSQRDALCLLVASENASTISRERLEVMTQTSDGFKIAEEDLRIRGPGQIFGTAQHGLPELKVADLIEDFELLRLARRDAFAMVFEDPGLTQPAHQQLRRELLKAYGGKLGLLGGA